MANEGEDEENALLINDKKNEETASKKSWRRICTWKKAGIAFVAFLALSAAAVGGYEIGKPATSSATPALPLHHPSLLICPNVIPLNGEFKCPQTLEDNMLQYWEGAHIGEAWHSRNCIPDCTGPQKNYAFKNPKVFVCEENSTALQELLDKMDENNIPYGEDGDGSFESFSFRYYAYSSTNFTIPKIHFTVDEIQKDKKAMAIIGAFFNYSRIFYPNPCKKWILGEGEK